MEVAHHDDIPRGMELKSIILVDDADWHVGVPLSVYGSNWWGRQTEWCTRYNIAAFETYDRQSKLIVFRKRGQGFDQDRSWQLHPATGEFRDQTNRRASWRGFLQRHPEVAGRLMAAFALRLAAESKRDPV